MTRETRATITNMRGTMTRAETSEGDEGDNDDGDGATRTGTRTGLDDNEDKTGFTPSYNRDIYICLHYSENENEG